MTEKLTIETLPVTDAFLREKRLIQDRGELALIADGTPIQHLTYFSLKSGHGFFRGGHYHREKTEHFYVIEGTLRIVFVDMESGERGKIQVETGQRITIYPHCAHRFEAIKETQVIEYFNAIYDKEDDVPYHDF